MIPPDELSRIGLGQVERGEFARASESLERAGRGYLARGQLADSARVLIASAQLASAAGALARCSDLLDEAEPIARRAGAASALLTARAELADARGEPDVRAAAWRACAAAGDRALAQRAWQRLGVLARERADAAGLREAIEQSLAIAVDAGDAAGEADLRIELAVAISTEDPTGAAAELDRAESLLSANDHELRSRLIGQRGVLALLADRPDDAAALARSARSAAVEANAVIPYLASTSLLVMVHQRRGDELGALDEILRARASLIDLLGERGAGLIEPALQMFEQRVGGERYQQLVAAWRAVRIGERDRRGDA